MRLAFSLTEKRSSPNSARRLLRKRPSWQRRGCNRFWDDESRLSRLYDANQLEIVSHVYDPQRVQRQLDDTTGSLITARCPWDNQNILLETDENDATQIDCAHEPETYGKRLSQRRPT